MSRPRVFRIREWRDVLREGVPFRVESDGTPSGTRVYVGGREIVGVRAVRAEVSAATGRNNRKAATIAYTAAVGERDS